MRSGFQEIRCRVTDLYGIEPNGALRFNIKEINEFIRKNRVQPVNADRKAKKLIGEKVKFGHNHSDSGQKTPR